MLEKHESINSLVRSLLLQLKYHADADHRILIEMINDSIFPRESKRGSLPAYQLPAL